MSYIKSIVDPDEHDQLEHEEERFQEKFLERAKRTGDQFSLMLFGNRCKCGSLTDNDWGTCDSCEEKGMSIACAERSGA